MKNIRIILAILVAMSVAAVAFVYIVKPQLDNRMVAVTTLMSVSNEDLAFGFSYLSGPDAYSLVQPPIATTSSGLQAAYILFPSSEFYEYQNDQSAGRASEAPLSMSVFVVELPDIQVEGGRIARLQTWAQANPQYTSYSAITSEPEVVEVDGAQALRYQTSGQREQQVYLVSYQGNAYVFTGQYEIIDDAYYQSFSELVNSVLFY